MIRPLHHSASRASVALLGLIVLGGCESPLGERQVVDAASLPGDGGGAGIVDASPLPDAARSLGLPGAGSIRAEMGVVLSDSALAHSVWRGEQEYVRQVPIADGQPDWGSATAWMPGESLADLPGSGALSSQAGFLRNDGLVRQAIWREEEGGYARLVPLDDGGSLDVASAGDWDGPLGIDEFPGSGAMRSQVAFALFDHVQQAIWRGSEGYQRQVPFGSDGLPDWGDAGGWSGPITSEDMPGAGVFQAQDAFAVANTVFQRLWRSDRGYERTVPIGEDGRPDWDAAGPWSMPFVY